MSENKLNGFEKLLEVQKAVGVLNKALKAARSSGEEIEIEIRHLSIHDGNYAVIVLPGSQDQSA